MAEKTILPLRDNTSHQSYGNSGSRKYGRGENDRLLIGKISDGSITLRCRSYIKFNVGHTASFWDGVEEVLEAYIDLTFASGGDLFNGTAGRVAVYRLTADFDEGGHTNFSTDDYQWPSRDTSLSQSTLCGQDPDPISLNIIDLLRRVAPKRVAFPGINRNGLAHDDHGFALLGSPEDNKDAAVQVWSRHVSSEDNRPTLRIVYRPKNTAPYAGLVTPSGNVTAGFDFTGTFLDDDQDDYLTQVQVEVRKASVNDWDEAHLTTHFTKDATADVGGDWSITDFDRTKFRKATDYEARTRVYDRKSAASDWTDPVNAFRIVADDPTVMVTPVGSVVTMDGLLLTAPWTVDPVTEVAQVDVQLGTRGFGRTLWAYSYAPTLDERDAEEVQAPYRGPNLAAGLYEWRVRVTDRLGGQSDWDNDATLSLSVGVPDDEGMLELTTGFSPVMAKQRIVLRTMNQSDRGPGAVVAIIEDAANIGFSTYATAPGEFYFTLPVGHPQVSVCEPMRTHYSFQQYRQGRWKEQAAGLLRDFDAKDDDMVVYGIDYLGLLSMSVEAAKQSSADDKRKIPTKVTGTDGSRYLKKTIRSIIVDQLKRARGQDAQSPVKFIQTGRIDSFETKVTIYASFAERLSFIRGLIDSHKGAQTNGEERRSRLRVRWNPAADGGVGRYQFEALDGVGKDRDNLRLEYGSLIQGYRVIALDDFADRIYAIGKAPNHTIPYFYRVDAPGISQADWGTLGRANYWSDIVDEGDLQRRGRNLGTRMSRIGKRVALGIRVAGIAPFDGYDILDSFPLTIEDGVVSTSQYGSGYWTLWGLEYRVFPDEHDEITFILRPKGDTGTIGTDLIPSRPIHFSADWVWGTGPP